MVMTGKIQRSRINREHTVTKAYQPFQQILQVGTKVLGKSLTLNLLKQVLVFSEKKFLRHLKLKWNYSHQFTTFEYEQAMLNKDLAGALKSSLLT